MISWLTGKNNEDNINEILFKAIRTFNTSKVEAALVVGASPNAKSPFSIEFYTDRNQATPLAWAIFCSIPLPSIEELELEFGRPLPLPPLQAGVLQQELAAMQQLGLPQPLPAQVELIELRLRSSLLQEQVQQSRKIQIIKILIEAGADVDALATENQNIQFSDTNYNTTISCEPHKIYPPPTTIKGRILGNEYIYVINSSTSQSQSGNSLDIAKLLVSNSSNKARNLIRPFEGKSLSDEFIAEIFMPMAVHFVEKQNLFQKGSALNRLSIGGPESHIAELIGPYIRPLEPAIQRLCGVNAERAQIIAQKMCELFRGITPEKIALQKSFLLTKSSYSEDEDVDQQLLHSTSLASHKPIRTSNPLDSRSSIKNILTNFSSYSEDANQQLLDSVFAAIISPIRKSKALHSNIENKGNDLKSVFTKIFTELVTQSKFKHFQEPDRKQISAWANDITAVMRDKKNLKVEDLETIFTVLLASTINNHKLAQQALATLTPQQSKKAYIKELRTIANSAITRSKPKPTKM